MKADLIRSIEIAGAIIGIPASIIGIYLFINDGTYSRRDINNEWGEVMKDIRKSDSFFKHKETWHEYKNGQWYQVNNNPTDTPGKHTLTVIRDSRGNVRRLDEGYISVTGDTVRARRWVFRAGGTLFYYREEWTNMGEEQFGSRDWFATAENKLLCETKTDTFKPCTYEGLTTEGAPKNFPWVNGALLIPSDAQLLFDNFEFVERDRMN